MTAYDPNLDFNFEDDAKLPGLIPDGVYNGSVTSSAYDSDKSAIVWKVTLNGNGGKCTDEETDIDGQVLDFTNWLPKPGDEDIKTASGKMTKRQAKINMMAEFMKRMMFTQTTVGEVIEAISNAEYIGTEVSVQINTREWQGSVFNNIQKMYVPVTAEF